MSTVGPETYQIARKQVSIQTYARAAGALALLSFIAGGFGEVYVPSRLIVSGNAAATMGNLRALNFLFRVGFAGYLVEALCDVSLALVMYVLLKPVNRYISLLAAFFGLLATATFAVAEMFYFAPSLVLGHAELLKAFSADQLDALVFLSLRLFGLGGWIFTVFYGMGWMLRGYLMFKSGYLPKLLGVLLMIAGAAFFARNFAVVLAPSYSSGWMLALVAPGFLTMTVWFLTKGVNLLRWQEKAA